tara:strand:+ start:1311 stop:1961 length:651 start_codon:yes stop_codon:yes gene_type:complete
MKNSTFIFTSKSELSKIIQTSESISMTFYDGTNYFIEWEGDIPFEDAKMERTTSNDDGTELFKSYEQTTTNGPTALSQIIKEIWARVKKYDTITEMWINNGPMDLNVMVRDAEVKEAKKALNKTQISDRSIGLVSVIKPLKAKLCIGTDKNAIDMADALQDMLTEIRGGASYGVSKYAKKSFKESMAKMTRAMKEMENELNACASSESVRKLYGIK